MRAIVLSAGQGKRLLPLTANVPKCLLAVDGDRPVLEVQLETLARCGIEHVTVVTGFGADRVEDFLAGRRFAGLVTELLFNPFYTVSDNLATCWVARGAMEGDFVLLNGDTLFEPAVLRRLLTAPPAPLTVTIDQKPAYDADDMKVSISSSGRLLAVGKQLPPQTVGGESIGCLSLRGTGPRRFRTAVEKALRRPESLHAWYLSVVNALAKEGIVETASIRGLWWREIDSRADLDEVRSSFRDGAAAQPRRRAAG